MLPVFLSLAQTLENLLMGGRDLVLDAAFPRVSPASRAASRRMRWSFCSIPPQRSLSANSPVRRFSRYSGGTALSSRSYQSLIQLAVGGACDVTANPIEFLRLDACGQRLPTVAVAEQHDEVRLDAGTLAALDLAQADLHGLLVERRLVADAPAQVNGLEARAVLLAELAQLRETRSRCSASRSAFKSSKVELTKTRNVRVAVGMGCVRFLAESKRYYHVGTSMDELAVNLLDGFDAGGFSQTV